MHEHTAALPGGIPAIDAAVIAEPQSSLFRGASVLASGDGASFLVTFRRYSNTREAQVQLVATAQDFERLSTPEGYFLDSIDLLTLERNCGQSEGTRRVACMLARCPKNASELSHLVVTATGALYPVPQHASGEALAMADWRVIYSHSGVSHELA